MLTKFKNPLQMLGGFSDNSKSTSNKGLMVVGLQTLVHSSSEAKSISNVVLKSALKKEYNFPAASAAITESCYLKSCFLCNKNLSLDKDIYMYRGDQGFCSVECRSRQIVLDEMREMETSKKQMRKAYRQCSAAGRHETRQILQDLRRRHKHVPQRKHWAIAS